MTWVCRLGCNSTFRCRYNNSNRLFAHEDNQCAFPLSGRATENFQIPGGLTVCHSCGLGTTRIAAHLKPCKNASGKYTTVFVLFTNLIDSNKDKHLLKFYILDKLTANPPIVSCSLCKQLMMGPNAGAFTSTRSLVSHYHEVHRFSCRQHEIHFRNLNDLKDHFDLEHFEGEFVILFKSEHQVNSMRIK